ncbi:MAG: SPASM domain-containing protein [Flavobacteriales bacterium]|nr:SPASM domain-containing protein [Flavobacteriales bacterium]MCB9193101.1 SPASM domain-containing protein [Flavobacteriales bacterium]
MRADLRDGAEWGRRLTPRRARNAYRIWRSFRRARRTGDPQIDGLPVTISFEPTTACNLRCPECPSGLRSFTRPTGNLRPDLFTQVIDELAPDLWGLTFYFQGEPYINPGFLDMVRYARGKGIYTATSTNAHFLDEGRAEATVRSGLSRLIISLDGTDQATYEQYRREGDLQKVLEGAERIVRWKRKLRSRTPHVVFQFLVVRPNEHQVPEARELAKRIGVDDLWLKTAQVYDPRDDHPLIPTQDRYARYRRKADGTWEVKNRLDDHCWKMWHSCVITWDGRVVPCCFDKDAHHVLGDLRSQSFREIWTSAAYADFRRTLFTSRGSIEMCRNCSEGSPVWV